MNLVASLLAVCAVTLSAHAALPHLTAQDRVTLKTLFTTALGNEATDAQAAFHAVNGLKRLGEKVDAAASKVR